MDSNARLYMNDLTFSRSRVNARLNGVRVISTSANSAAVSSNDAVVVVGVHASSVRLPQFPYSGQIYTVKDGLGDAGTRNILITAYGSAKNIDGVGNCTISANYGSKTLVYNGTQWNVI